MHGGLADLVDEDVDKGMQYFSPNCVYCHKITHPIQQRACIFLVCFFKTNVALHLALHSPCKSQLQLSLFSYHNPTIFYSCLLALVVYFKILPLNLTLSICPFTLKLS